MSNNLPNFRTSPYQPITMGGGNSILRAHCGTIDYLLPPKLGASSQREQLSYLSNEKLWRDIIGEVLSAGDEVVLERFRIMNWFPRAPGLYHTPNAALARQEALSYTMPINSPIRDYAGRLAGTAGDYTQVFTPEGKISMLEGGIGCIRLKPIRIQGILHWLMTATTDGIAHAGIPIAVPLALCRNLKSYLRDEGAVCAVIRGELDFLDDPFSRVFDTSERVPRLYIRVTDLHLSEAPPTTLEVSVAVSFVSRYQGPPRVYATYVTFEPNIKGSFDSAVSWMKKVYVEGEYNGRIITDFDQMSTTFPEARLALSSVMDRLVSRGALRDSIELMHARASVEAYFNEIDRYNLLLHTRDVERTRIFISYAHAPEAETGWVSRLRVHLAGLANAGDIEVWDDSRIEAGQRWREEIGEAIRRAKLAILVLTPEFLASKFIREEELPLLLEAAEAEGASILCLYGSDVHLSGSTADLTKYQFVNSPMQPLKKLTENERESVYVKLVARAEKVLNHI